MDTILAVKVVSGIYPTKYKVCKIFRLLGEQYRLEVPYGNHRLCLLCLTRALNLPNLGPIFGPIPNAK